MKIIVVALCASLVAGASSASTDVLLWVENGQLTRQAEEVLAVMRRVEDFGLAREDFDHQLAEIEELNGNRAAAPRLEEVMNFATLRLIKQLHSGRVDPRAAGYAMTRQRVPLDVNAVLSQLASATDPPGFLASLEPDSSQYRALRHALGNYRRIRTDLNMLPVPHSAVIKVGDRYAGAEKLRWLLAEVGDATRPPDTAASETVYDAELSVAIARFQVRHGLEGDGVLGPKTFAALAVPISQRIRQIELTLERWRWLPDIYPPAVIVNVPQYMLYTLPNSAGLSPGSAPAAIRVIVGHSARQTPIFDSAIETVVFRPYWNVPTSILREELLPVIRKDPGYLARHDMEIVRGDGDDAEVLTPDAESIVALRAGRARLRQRPGPDNALGLVKFMLPNPYSVYLHSTPEAQLFARERRALSHGCIRVSDANALAAYLLKDTPGDWTAEAIEAATCSEASLVVRLARPVPVVILYATAVIDTDGAVLFFSDVYGYDRQLDLLLVESSRAIRYINQVDIAYAPTRTTESRRAGRRAKLAPTTHSITSIGESS